MKITAAIPTYNGADRIERALQSIRAQTLPPDEVLVVDDASCDDLTPVLARFADLPIRLVRHKQNLRDCGARNTAMREAKGEIVSFLDDDDEWFPEKLALQLPLIEHDPSEVIAFCPFVRHYVATGQEEIVRVAPKNWRRHFLYFGGLGSGTTLMVSKRAFARVGPFDESMPRLSDCDWLLRAHECGIRFRFTEQPQARVFFQDSKGGEATELGARIFLSKHTDLYRKEGRWFTSRSQASILTRIAERYALEGRLRDALRLATEALPYHPPMVVAKAVRAIWRRLPHSRRSRLPT